MATMSFFAFAGWPLRKRRLGVLTFAAWILTGPGLMAPGLSGCSAGTRTENRSEHLAAENGQTQNNPSMNEQAIFLQYEYGAVNQLSLDDTASAEVARLARMLLGKSESLRLYLDEEQMDEIMAGLSGFAVRFVSDTARAEPAQNAAPEPSVVTTAEPAMLLFLSEGDYAWHSMGAANVCFFVAMDDGIFIQSPFLAEEATPLLDQLMKMAGL